MTRHERLREVAEKRLERLEKKAEHIRKHLKDKPDDLQAWHYLLHRVLVQYNDIKRNLEDEEWVPKPKKVKEKRKTERPSIPEPLKQMGPQPGPQTHIIKEPQPLPPERDKDLERGTGRSWCCAAFVELEIPLGKEEKIFEKLEPISNKHDEEIVRRWAINKFGSIKNAKESLKLQATLPENAAVWRALIKRSKSGAKFDNLSDEDLLADKSARNIARKWHEVEWVKATADEIKQIAPKGVAKDHLEGRLKAHLSSFHAAANRGKHTNPQFPYLAEDDTEVPDLNAALEEWFRLPSEERFKSHPDDPKKRGYLTLLQQDLGRLKRLKHWRGTEKRQPWAGRTHYKAITSRRREGALLWDKQEDRFVFAIPVGGESRIDEERYVYTDGKSLHTDNQLTGKSCLILPLKPKHDFLRWYEKHVENHNPNAPLHRRCANFCTQYVLIPPEGRKPAQLFIRPVFKFLDENDIEVPDTHSFYKKPQCRYLIGIDRGINYPYRAVVLDAESNTVIADVFIHGRKNEWKRLRDALAYHQSRRDTLRNAGASPSAIEREIKQIKRLRRKERGLNKIETVESIANLVSWAERELGAGEYCFVIENLGDMNLKRNNRVKYLAAIYDALFNQMRKHGYKFTERKNNPNIVDGLREEWAYATSQLSPSGWYASREIVESALAKDKTQYTGRKIGFHFCCEPDERDLYHKVKYAPPAGGGRRNVLWVKGTEWNPQGQRWRHLGQELFWDPTVKHFAGIDFPHGIVLDADFIGAFNVALRPLVKDGKGKGFGGEEVVEAHQRLNPTIKFDCEITAYEFVEVDGDPRGALRKVILHPKNENFCGKI